MTIKSLKNISFDTVFATFNKAFADYEMQLNKVELQRMLKRRGYVPELSFGAFDDDVLVSFTLNGIGLFNKQNTAYDTGTGTIKEYRGQGLATQIFEYSVPVLKEAGVEQYLLEVLQHNEKAVSIYSKLGFRVSREFNYFVQNAALIQTSEKSILSDIVFKEVDLNKTQDLVSMHDFVPSWQNSFESIQRTPEDYICLAALKDGHIVAYCIFDPRSGDITQLAVDKLFRRKRIATALLSLVLKKNTYNSVKLINSEVGCEALTSFLSSIKMPLSGKQYEMIKML